MSAGFEFLQVGWLFSTADVARYLRHIPDIESCCRLLCRFVNLRLYLLCAPLEASTAIGSEFFFTFNIGLILIIRIQNKLFALLCNIYRMAYIGTLNFKCLLVVLPSFIPHQRDGVVFEVVFANIRVRPWLGYATSIYDPGSLPGTLSRFSREFGGRTWRSPRVVPGVI